MPPRRNAQISRVKCSASAGEGVSVRKSARRAVTFIARQLKSALIAKTQSPTW